MDYMPFGKYRGWMFHEIPHDYLGWLLDHTDIDGELRRQVEQEFWGRRTVADGPPEPEASSEEEWQSFKDAYRRSVEEALRTAYREMARQHHPDLGGSHDVMVAINNFYDRFNEVLSELAI
jgi:hypothetical protein